MLVAQTKSIQLRSIDSALTVTDTTRDVYLKIGLLGKISYAYQYIDFDKSVLFADSVVRLSKENDYKFGLAKGYNFLGLAYQTIGKLDLALKNYLKSLYINKNQGILKESGKNLNNIASVLIAIGDIESAKKYANEAYEVNKEFRNSNSLAISLSIFSDIAYKEKDLKKAISYLKKARRVQADNSSIFDDGFYHTKMGELYSAKGVKDSAEFAFYKVLGYQNAEPDQVIKALIGLSTIRLEQNRLNESENFLSKALQIAKTSNAQLELISVYNALVNLNIKKEDYKEALNYTKIKDELKDKVLGYNTSGQISSSLNKIITDQKDQENDDLRLFAQFKEMELKKQNTISILLVAGISITIFLGILLYINFLNKNKAYHQLDIANKTIQKQNQDLEQIIALRTETIRKKNEKLKELAYFNSHQIRKHTANILGLILISGFEDNKNQYFRMIENEAKSLEDVIEQINEMTSD
jgi:tetratricopeptide (TPR) repeat protein